MLHFRLVRIIVRFGQRPVAAAASVHGSRLVRCHFRIFQEASVHITGRVVSSSDQRCRPVTLGAGVGPILGCSAVAVYVQESAGVSELWLGDIGIPERERHGGEGNHSQQHEHG